MLNSTLRCVGIVALCLIATAANAEQLVYFAENPRGLYNFDTQSGQSTLRAAMTGTERFFGMDRRPSDGTIFAVDLFGAGLWTINANTGQENLIGALTPAIDDPQGIAFNPSNGNLYVSNADGNLYTVNPSTAADTLIGTSGIGIRGNSFSPDGSRFLAFLEGSGDMYSVNPATGGATRFGSSIPSGVPEDTTFTPDGQLFGTDFHGNLYQINPQTGAASVIGSTGLGDGLLGLVALPEPSTLLLISTCLLSFRPRFRS